MRFLYVTAFASLESRDQLPLQPQLHDARTVSVRTVPYGSVSTGVSARLTTPSVAVHLQDKDGGGELVPESRPAAECHQQPYTCRSSQRDANWLALPGDITAAELGQVMRELGLNPSDAELRDLVNEADLNNDGVISFDGTPVPGLLSLLTSDS